jgi:hypothetical protein
VNDEPSTAGSPVAVAPPPETRPPRVRTRPGASVLDPTILRRAVGEAFVKLGPRHMIGNPVMFVVEVGSVVTTIEFLALHVGGRLGGKPGVPHLIAPG